MTNYLLMEFGGTNARFAIASPEKPTELLHLQCQPCASFSSAEEAVIWYLDRISRPTIKATCLAVAGPVDKLGCRLTNKDWTFSQQSIAALTGAQHVEFLNDFEALAYALPFLPGQTLLPVRQGVSLGTKPKVVLGPGTGLGVACLLTDRSGNFQVVSSEGGGVGFAPEDELECSVMMYLNKRQGRVTCEDLLSGPGLVQIYRAIAAISGGTPRTLTPADISGEAANGADVLCVQAVHSFCHILGHFAGDLALTFNAAGGVYLGGGILPKIRDAFLHSDFCQRFERRGKKSALVKDIPVYLIEGSVPALVGAGYWLKSQLRA